MRIQKGPCSWQPGVTLLLAVCFFCKSVASLSDPVETAALKSFRQNLLDPNGSLSSWTGNDPCGDGWKWVFCEAPGPGNVSQITELRLFDLNLSGSLVPELGNLSYLLYLNLMWNNLSGSIPSTLGNLKNLYMLLLNGNNFSGTLPQELGQLTKLNRIQIDQNNFTGPIPNTFGNLTNVMHLHMNNNSLNGSLPPELGKLQKVIHLLLDNNKLSGNLSADIAKAPSLLIIQLDNNQLSNVSIPPAWVQIPTLLKLSLKNCGLQGNISDISRLTSLQVLDVSDNNLAGTLPDITYPVNLTSIDISNNRLSGQFPVGIGNLQQLQALLLENNNITGSLPSNLGSAPPFQSQQSTLLDLQNNSITSFNNTPLVNLIGSTGTKVWLSGNNLICYGAEVQNNPVCVPHVDSFMTGNDTFTSSTPAPNGCLCTSPFVVASSTNNTQCHCVQPIIVGFRLKSPSFQYFDRYEQGFLSWLSNGLNLSSTDTNIKNAYWSDSRLTMTLLLLPATGTTFNASEFNRLSNAFSQWQIPDSPIFGPYEVLSFDPRRLPDAVTISTQNGLSKGAIAGIVLGAAALTAIVVGAIMFCILPRRRAVIAKTRRASLSTELKDAALKVAGVKAFTFEELSEITDEFDEKNEVGEGGYGKVYKGKLRDGQWVAIKRAQVGSLQGAREFYTEIDILSRVHHRNLVELVGYCNDEDEQMLVYEYMSGGTLRDHLIETSKVPLDFLTRLSIALGSARGILYLHTEANPPIFHRDIKASNILLDEKKIAKVADFGLSRLAPVPDLEGATPDHISTVVKGTPGYLDPEYFLTHQLTDKSDVYSFGVVLLEFVTGRQPISMGKNIVREVSASYEKGTVLDCVDGRMGPFTADAMEQLIQLALACVRDVPEERPNMGEVVRELESILRATPYSLQSEGSSVDLGYVKSMHPADHGFVSTPSSINIEQSDLTQLMSHTITRIPPR